MTYVEHQEWCATGEGRWVTAAMMQARALLAQKQQGTTGAEGHGAHPPVRPPRPDGGEAWKGGPTEPYCDFEDEFDPLQGPIVIIDA